MKSYNKKPKTLELENYMANYYGTEHYYTDWAYKFKYTDGVKAFCEKAGAYWILDIVNSLFFEEKYAKKMNGDFIAIKLNVVENNKATITFEDSESKFYSQDIPFTDCPEGEWIFFYDDGILIWHSEY